MLFLNVSVNIAFDIECNKRDTLKINVNNICTFIN